MTNQLIILLFLISQLMLGAPAKAEGTIKVALYPNPPQLFTDEQGKPQGLVADVLKHIASKEGWQIEYVPCETRKCLEQLENGQLDLMCPIAFKKERTNRYDFTNEILLANWAQIFARPGMKIKSILDLDGKKIAVIDGVVLTNNFRKMLKNFDIKTTFVAVPNFSDILRLIDQGEVDAGVLNRLSGILNKSKYNVEQTPIIFSPVEIRFAAPKGQRKDLLATIDRYLAELKADTGSIYYQSLDRHLALGQKRVFPKWAKWILGLTVSFVFLFVGVSILLRNQVRARTVNLVNEIAERKQAEEALQKSEERFRTVADFTYD